MNFIHFFFAIFGNFSLRLKIYCKVRKNTYSYQLDPIYYRQTDTQAKHKTLFVLDILNTYMNKKKKPLIVKTNTFFDTKKSEDKILEMNATNQ